MEFGCQFEDDFFEEPKQRERKIDDPKNYRAKIIKPFWYMETTGDETPKEMLTKLQLRGNFYFVEKNFAKAVEEYSQCVKLVPSSNNTWKRELIECLAYSFLNLGDAEKALEWSLKLNESSRSEDQKVNSMNLLARVCHTLGKFKEELEALHTCLQTHKNYPEFWLRLGLCYAGLFKIDLPGYSILPKLDKEETEPCCAFNLKHRVSPQSHSESVASVNQSTVPVENGACSNLSESESITTKCDFCSLGVQIVSSCLIRTKTLIESQASPAYITYDRDEQTKEKIGICLKYMEVDESFIEVAAKMLGSDFLTLSEVHDSFTKTNSSQ